MKTIYLVGCSAQKHHKATTALDLYKGDLFKKSVQYATSCGAKQSEIFVLSALHGLMKHSDNVGPYDVTLNDMTAQELRTWAAATGQQLKNLIKGPVKIICLAGKKYAKAAQLVEAAALELPLKGLGIGQQKAWLLKEINNNV